MNAKLVDSGARRYVVGSVEQFDQKNEMFCRPLWDEEMLDLGKKFYMTEVPPQDKPGFRLKDARDNRVSTRPLLRRYRIIQVSLINSILGLARKAESPLNL